MKKRKLIIAGLLLTLVTALAAGCKDNNREDYLEDRVEQLEQQVTDMEKNTGSSTSQTPSDNTDAAGTDANNSDSGNNGNASSDTKADDYETLRTSVNDVSDKANAATPTGSVSEQRDQYYSLKQELDGADQQLDRYDDELERQYHSGALDAAGYRDKERQIDELEDIIDTAEDKLERTFGIDD